MAAPRIECKRTGGWCSAMKCVEVAPCPKTERPFNGRSCPRCGETKLEESVGIASHWVACTRCNWSTTTFFNSKSKQRQPRKG